MSRKNRSSGLRTLACLAGTIGKIGNFRVLLENSRYFKYATGLNQLPVHSLFEALRAPF
jgi:hypothetical protein